jgi:hypothetical protein
LRASPRYRELLELAARAKEMLDTIIGSVQELLALGPGVSAYEKVTDGDAHSSKG